ncbi:DUF6932 family protein [Chryseobacterium gambrini]|uniref:DUF6932 family protein n=1 Tax=Chryseobacterium gambrini TaxID=373672 RepID=UPI003D0B0E8A
MSLKFQLNGNLEIGIHSLSWDDFELNFGYNLHRKRLLEGLKLAISHLKLCNCNTLYVDGSFVTTKLIPRDFDACWDAKGVNFATMISLYPTLVDFDDERKNQKLLYKGELFPMHIPADKYNAFIDFFQLDKEGNPKGIVKLTL